MTKKEDKQYIEDIIMSGSREERLSLYAFDSTDSVEMIAKKFNLFVVANFTRYYTSEPAPFHQEMIENFIKAYRGEINYLNIGFRGCAKTSLKKLFDTYTILNDIDKSRKFYKVMTADITNSKQIIVDVYNLIVEVAWLYGDVFAKEGKKKREETMQAFTLKDGRRYAGGTVGQVARGQLQDASRPDYIWFEDVENSDTTKSIVKTQTIIDKSDESIQGMSPDGSYVVTANYISDTGVIEWFKIKKSIHTQITPIIDEDYLSTWSERYSQEKILELKKDANDWEGDYLCNPESSDSIFFDREIVDKMLTTTKKPIKQVGLVDIWEEYKPNHVYAIGGDTSEGVGLDSNALTIHDFTAGSIMGSFHSNTISPDLFGYEMVNIGEAFGGCLLVPEINNTGHATITAIKEKSYTKIYKQVRTDRRTNTKTEKLGWSTTNKTKHEMWFNFKTAFEEGEIDIYDEELLLEMRSYTREDFMGTTTGIVTRHFDLLTSAVVGWAGKTQAYVKKERKIARRKVRNTTIGL